MPETTKITLSDKELSMAKDADWILTKHGIIEKVYELFTGRISFIQHLLGSIQAVPLDVKSTTPKIYRGENYRMLPYVLLDYPRSFEKEDVFAIRTMFWWGNFFSITLHLSGKYGQMFEHLIYLNDEILMEGIYVCLNETQWEHHFERDNYVLFNDLSLETRMDLFARNGFLKLSIQFNIDDWNNMPELLDSGYIRLKQILVQG